MNLMIKPCLQFISLVGAILLLSVWLDQGEIAYAFHFPWDQGHDTFKPNPPDNDNPPDNNNNDDDGDPVEVLSGNFLFNRTRHDIRILDQGPPLELLFAYHSQDLYNGPFGHGWHSSLTSMAIKVTNGNDKFVIIRRGDGRRKRYKLNQDGTFQPPTGVYQRLIENADGTFTLTFRGGQIYRYQADGRLVRIEAINQQAVTIGYDQTGAILTATTAGGRVLNFIKGANGKIESVVDPLAGVFHYQYDTAGNLVQVTDPLGNITQYVYDNKHNMTQVKAPDGTVEISNQYDALDRVSTQTLLQGTVRFFYDNSTQTRVQDTQRGTITHQFNSAGLPTTTRNAQGQQIVRVWDSNLNLHSVTDPSSKTTTFEYDANGNLISQTAGSVLTRFVYDGTYNRLIAVTDEAGSVIAAVSYDDALGLIRIVDANNVTNIIPAASYGLLETGIGALGFSFPYTSRYPLHQ